MKPARLLVVDDEPGMLRAVERVLGRRHQVASYESPLDALAAARDYDPDLAILDVRMPNMDGFELMGRLQELVPGIDTILMTGSASEPDQKLIRAVRENAFYFIQKPFDSEVLRTLVERCLELRQLADENKRHVRRLEGELSQAQAFQRSLLPRPEALINGIALAGRYQPTSELGGDFFDFARVGTTGAALVIADVSGHGVSAAMLTGVVKAGFRAAQVDDFDPVAVVEQVRASLRGFGYDQFITMVAARITGDTLEYVSAGHPSTLVRTPAGLTVLDSTGPIVSPVFPSGSWATTRHAFGPGASLVLYTDGISEARSPADELFGDERVAATVAAFPGNGAPLLDALLNVVRAWSAGRPMADDLTLVTASRG
ncbi:MAG TPA: SpoIIE family protein phosphatase [Candidatus Eisenbacteria bacterium]